MTTYWEVRVYADQTEVRANRVDARFVDKEIKTVTLLEMSCPRVENKKQKEEEKTIKYVPLWLNASYLINTPWSRHVLDIALYKKYNSNKALSYTYAKPFKHHKLTYWHVFFDIKMD